MATKKYRKRKKNRHGDNPIMTVTIQPGEVPSDSDLDAEAAALETDTDDRYEQAKKDDISLAKLQRMSTDELAKLARDEDIHEFTVMPKQKLVFEILKSRARRQGLMMGEGTLEVLPDG
ncbi:MAG: Rho termination factor N-terminal domain-containing protein, partial [Phycisphaerales bacterium]